MYRLLRDKFADLYSTFHGSETILLARFNAMIGSLYVAVAAMDLSPFDLNPKYVAGWVAFNGFLSEYLRRRNAEFNDDGSMK